MRFLQRKFFLFSFAFFLLAPLFALASQWIPTNSDADMWVSVKSSSDGSKVFATNGINIYRSVNGGVDWVMTSAPTVSWNVLTVSSDGLKIAAVNSASDGGVYLSTDGGNTWAKSSAPSGQWINLTATFDGVKLFAVLVNSTNAWSVYYSSDSGATWVLTPLPQQRWNSVAVSRGISNSSGVAAAVSDGGAIWRSTDGGFTWYQTTSPIARWNAVTVSSNGLSMFATIATSNQVYRSSNFGKTWSGSTVPVASTFNLAFNSVAASSDGSRVVVTDLGHANATYLSTDGGYSWANIGKTSTYFYFIDGDSSVSTLFAGGNYDVIYKITPADLTVGPVTPTATDLGTFTVYSATITNSGPGSTVDSFNYFPQFQAPAGAGGATTDGASSTLSALNSGQSAVGSFTAGFSYEGIYKMRICADKSSSADIGVIIESDETNNCGPWTSIAVGGGGGVLPDLTAGAATPTSVNQLGAPTLFSAQINNTTVSPVGGFNYFFQLASNANGTGSVTDLAASSTQLSPPASDPTLPPATGYRYVGPTRTYTTPSQAFAAAQDGNYILIDAGTYTDDFATINANNLVIKSVGGKARIVQSSGATNPNGKGLWVTAGSNITIDGIEFVGATLSAGMGANGAGILAEGAGLMIRNSYFHNNQDGILATANPSSDILIESSEFANNGDTGNGAQNNVYVGAVRTFTFRYNYDHDAVGGELLKSRAYKNVVIYNRFVGSSNNNSPYVHFPVGGDCFVIGNIFYAPLASSYFIYAGEESLSNPTQQLSIVNNTFVSPQTIHFFSAVPNSYAKNDLFVGDSMPLYYGTNVVTGSIRSNPSGNLFFALSSFTGFVDKANYDFRLSSGSSAIDRGVIVPPVNGTSLVPTDQYQTNLSHETRTTTGSAIDVGAYEYGADFQSTIATTNITFSFAGTYSTRVCADKSSTGDPGIITESDETNNCGPWTNVTVTSTNPTGTISASPCTLQGGSCMVYLAFNAIILGGNRTYVKQTDPEGIVSTIYSVTGMDSVSAPSLGVSATKVGSYLYQLYIDNPSATLLAATTTLVYTPPTLLCNGQTACATDIGGTSVTLTWNCPQSGASSVGTLFATLGAQSGSKSVTPIATTTYGIQCNPPGNTAQVTVSVATPMLQIDVPSHVRKNATTTLSWNATHVSSCTLSGKGVSQSTLAGSIITPPIAGLTVYTLSCATNSGVVSIVRTIRMVPLFKEP